MRPLPPGEIIDEAERVAPEPTLSGVCDTSPAEDRRQEQGSDSRRPFVGRSGELEALRSRLGRAGLIMLTGDPGIGKTRLAEEFAAEAQRHGAVVRWGRCWEGEGAPAFWPWIQIIRDHAHESDPETLRVQLGAAAPDVARLVAELRGCIRDVPEPPELDAAQSRFRLFDGVTTFLGNVAAARPLVLVLEDLHSADRPSLLLLRFLVRQVRGVPLLVIGTYRSVEVGRAHPLADVLSELARQGEELPLTGLSAPEVQQYLELVLGAAPARGLATRLHRETEGVGAAPVLPRQRPRRQRHRRRGHAQTADRPLGARDLRVGALRPGDGGVRHR